ncbi:MAG: hypothetical protein ACREBF_02660 [Candidatus Micrarchaeales archaeon]
MAKIKLDEYSTYVLHTLGKKGGPELLVALKRDLVSHGKKPEQATLLLRNMRDKYSIAKITGALGNEIIELNELGKALYDACKK